MRRFKVKKEVGIAVLAKYEHRCTECGSEDQLCIHHIIRMPLDDDRYSDIENLTVLCRSCHMRHHRAEGDIKPSTPPPPGNPYGRRGKNNPPVQCRIEGCDLMQHGKALCRKHYESNRRKLKKKNS